MVPIKSCERLVFQVLANKDKNENIPLTISHAKQPQPDQLNQAAKFRNQCGISGRCINGVYHVLGNLSLGGAFAGAALQTVANLNDRQKDAVGALTMSLIFIGAFCFWNLACCPQRRGRSNSDTSFYGLQSTPFSGGLQNSNQLKNDQTALV